MGTSGPQFPSVTSGFCWNGLLGKVRAGLRSVLHPRASGFLLHHTFSYSLEWEVRTGLGEQKRNSSKQVHSASGASGGSAEPYENIIFESEDFRGSEFCCMTFHLRFVQFKALARCKCNADDPKAFDKNVSRQDDNKNVGSFTSAN